MSSSKGRGFGAWVYTAGETGGLHSVKTTVGDREVIAEVRVRTDESKPADDDGNPIAKPDKQVLRWRGTISHQKWTQFSMKVLTRLASSDLKLDVSFEIPLDPEQAKSKQDDTRSGLEELGLDDNVTLS